MLLNSFACYLQPSQFPKTACVAVIKAHLNKIETCYNSCTTHTTRCDTV